MSSSGEYFFCFPKDYRKTSLFHDFRSTPTHPPSFLNKLVVIDSPNLTGCFLFLLDLHAGAVDSDGGCFEPNDAAEVSS